MVDSCWSCLCRFLDTCCLIDILSSLGSCFPLHDFPSQIGFSYVLSSLKRLLAVLSGMRLLVWKQQDLKSFMSCCCWEFSILTLRMSGCPGGGLSHGNLFGQAQIYCLWGKIDIPPQTLNIYAYACVKGAGVHMGGKCFDKPRQSHCCCAGLMVALLLYKRTSLC